ncbi:MAG: preprotein translocase subunit SecG [Flavobacteriaceae bacterium]|nr:MAG: preprotein translocase subunit SecG [Flavobacteriaceae bacterium]
MSIGFQILMVLAIFLCVLVVIVILSQDPKGGGLSGSFGGGGTQMFGAQKTNDFLDKATWFLGGSIVLVIVLANLLMVEPTNNVDLPKTTTPKENATTGAPIKPSETTPVSAPVAGETPTPSADLPTSNATPGVSTPEVAPNAPAAPATNSVPEVPSKQP